MFGVVELVVGGVVVVEDVVDGEGLVEFSFSILKNGEDDNAIDNLGEALGEACTALEDAVLLVVAVVLLFKLPFKNGELER